jgi:hypothetical protein
MDETLRDELVDLHQDLEAGIGFTELAEANLDRLAEVPGPGAQARFARECVRIALHALRNAAGQMRPHLERALLEQRQAMEGEGEPPGPTL